MSTVLVLLAARNGAQCLIEQVESILSQQHADLRLLIGDDCSDDGAVDALMSNQSDQRLKALGFDKPSGGAGASFLRLLSCADLSSFDFIAFSDQDDVWHADKLARGIAALEECCADGYSAAVTAFWADGREQLLGQNPNRTDLDFLFEGAGQGCTFVLRSEFARQVQQFVCSNRELLSAIHYHDWLVYAASRTLGKRWVFDPVPSMRYRQHGGNDTGARGALAGVRKRLGLIRDGWYASQVRQMIVAVSALDAMKAVIPADFLAIWNCQHGLTRRLQLAGILFKRGRRRFSDRAVLAVSALLGWL